MKLFSKRKQPDQAGDADLLQQYRQSGDLAVLGRLYEQYMPLVYGVCLKYLQDEEQSKDAVMQIFEELVIKVTRHEIKEFRPWLYVLSRNYCLMQLRTNKKMETLSLEEVMESPFVLHPDDNDEHKINQLEDCLKKLTPAQQQSIQIFYLQEKSYKEVAEHTGYSLNEVKSYIQNGKRNLKICLENNRER
ncbi:sigma-70 family RNA polymerase sigma factor [Mucilaginibacter robiniae]|uniref:Sigma-70 family RNA polymerase sigma factor n=1 Tax=Mucilaginibacter robiniae TaxID=2728022 RepID=A0A7L5DW71_9SPHI|nr:sigma-70 family RNA polymerase sigma factor [Mucilaginibacter robiniae]QJD95342.1 sigma-70 family RNA polymerase sigma factor [Mucilaginibacter robiniae]